MERGRGKKGAKGTKSEKRKCRKEKEEKEEKGREMRVAERERGEAIAAAATVVSRHHCHCSPLLSSITVRVSGEFSDTDSRRGFVLNF